VANDGILSFYLANAPKIACIYLSVWAVRYKAGIDRPLDGRAKTVRWSVTAAGFIVVRMASSPYVRLIGFTVGMVLLCWPNVAYHLTKKIVSWPTTQGFVESASPVESGWRIGYSFRSVKIGSAERQLFMMAKIAPGTVKGSPSQSVITRVVRTTQN